MSAVTASRRLLGPALTVLAAGGLLAGCAVVQPPSTVPPTGWPDAPAASPGARVRPPATPVDAASPAALPVVTKPGFVVPLPPGYLDASALVTDAPSAGPTRLVAYLRNPEQHGIAVQTWATDARTLADFLTFYVAATDGGTESRVTGRRPVPMGGGEGAELTLQARAGGAVTTTFVAMPKPGTLVLVTAPTPDEARRRAVEQVATGLRFT